MTGSLYAAFVIAIAFAEMATLWMRPSAKESGLTKRLETTKDSVLLTLLLQEV